MKGIMFEEDLTLYTTQRIKTATRRIGSFSKCEPGELFDVNLRTGKAYLTGAGTLTSKRGNVYKPRYKAGEKVYIKEPYYVEEEGYITYKYGLAEEDRNIWKWKNKMFMGARYARHYIRIKDVYAQLLYSISEREAKMEACNVLGECSSHRTAFINRVHKINKIKQPNNLQMVWVYEYTYIKPKYVPCSAPPVTDEPCTGVFREEVAPEYEEEMWIRKK